MQQRTVEAGVGTARRAPRLTQNSDDSQAWPRCDLEPSRLQLLSSMGKGGVGKASKASNGNYVLTKQILCGDLRGDAVELENLE